MCHCNCWHVNGLSFKTCSSWCFLYGFWNFLIVYYACSWPTLLLISLQKNIRGALATLKQMEDAGVKPNYQTFCYLLMNCNREEDINKVLTIIGSEMCVYIPDLASFCSLPCIILFFLLRLFICYMLHLVDNSIWSR